MDKKKHFYRAGNHSGGWDDLPVDAGELDSARRRSTTSMTSATPGSIGLPSPASFKASQARHQGKGGHHRTGGVTRRATSTLSPSVSRANLPTRSNRTSMLSLTGHPSCRATDTRSAVLTGWLAEKGRLPLWRVSQSGNRRIGSTTAGRQPD